MHRARFIAVAVVCMAFAGSAVVAQSALAVLGLSETGAREFVMNEIKSPSGHRTSAIAVAGTRAFLKLPPTARGPAATALFAWAKAYVSSPAFMASYASYRKGRIPEARQYALSVEAEVKKDIDDQLAGIEQLRQAADKMPPKDRAAMLESANKMRANLTDPAFIKQLEAQVAAARAAETGQESQLAEEVEALTPADPRKLFARRLREFLDATTDVNSSARTISLTGGFDGIEFVDKADRARHWMWQSAAIVGPEATAAARAAAAAWLKEIGP